MLEFLTSGTFLVIMEIVVIASLGAVLIWRIKKNNQATKFMLALIQPFKPFGYHPK